MEDNPHHHAMHYPPNRIASKHIQVTTMSLKYASLTKHVFLCFFCILITAAEAGVSRELLQRSPGERVIVDESNSASFRTLVTNAAENSTIELHLDSLELTELLTISTRGLSIEGHGSVLVNVDCVQQGGGLQINATLVVLRNLRIRNCRKSAVSIFNPDVKSDPFDFDSGRNFTSIEVRLEDLEFVNNDATESQGQGGAIRIGAGTGVSIKDSNFTNNSASTGGAILIDNGGSLKLLESTFLNNQAILVGGAIAGGVSSNWFTTESIFSIQNCTFLENHALSGGEDPIGLTLSNGAPLENSVFLKFPSPSPSGGAIYIHGFNEVEIKGSRFKGNQGVPAGGALYISDNQNIKIENCTFDDNVAMSENQRSADLELGGAIYLVFTNMRSAAKIDRCLFRRNQAAFGGAIHTVTQLTTKLSVENSLFEDNSADLAAGALLMRNSIQSKIRNVRFVRNKAVSGGALMLTNGAGAFLFKGPSPGIELDIYFTNNSALDGGGVFLLGAGQTNFQSVRFEGNRAGRNGGGICLIESLPSGRTTIQEGVFNRNSALRGGGIYVDSISYFTLTSVDENSNNEFIENRALAGGALHIRPSSQVNNLIKIIRSVFLRNQAVSSRAEARIDALDLPEVHVEVSPLGRHLRFDRSLSQSSNPSLDALVDPGALDACNPGGGGAICLLIGQVPERAPIEVLISESRFVNNQGLVGGALFLATNVENEWIATCASLGSAVESLTSKPCKAMLISQVEFTKNQAKFAGGAIFASNPMSVYFDRSGKGKQVSLQSISSKDPIFQQNSIRSGGFGPNIASNAASLEILKPKRGPHELLFSEHNSGSELERGIELVLLDAYNQSVSNGIIDSTMSVSISSSIISGQRVAMAEQGIIKFTKVIARGPPDRHTLTFQPNSHTTKPIKADFSIRQCVPGEFRIDDQNICDKCREDYFGFNFTFNCDGCPDNAICPGGPALVPDDGFWHSTPFSPLLHECILEDACSYDDRKTKLAQYFNDPLDLNVSNQSVKNEDYPQCADGYEGPLCGSCADGYGHVVDGECCKCEQLWLTSLLIGIVCIWTLLLLISTAQQAFDTIREMQDVHSVGVAPSSHDEVLPRSVSETSGISAKKFASESGDENVDHIMAAERVAEIIKILTNFLQITAVGVGINASWTESVAILLVIEDSISSISSGASFAPMECLIKHLEDRSLIGIVLRAIFPIILTGIYILINIMKSKFDRKNLKRKVVIQAIVGLFFAYDTVSEMLMRIVSCISLDVVSGDALIVLQRYGEYAIARESYWAEDTRHVCWKGSHAIVAGVLGVPGLVLFTFGVPLLMAGFLIYKRKDDTVLKPEFLDTYGFVFQSYRVKFVYWESVVMLRKASMAAVIVYSYDLGPNLQAAIALGILIFSLLAQFLAQPFKYPSLNVLESLSLLASIFVFYAGVIFSDPNTTYGGKVALSAIILLTNITIVGVFLYCLFNAYDHLIIVKLRMAKAQVPERWFGRVKTLSLVQAEKVKEKLVASAKRPGAVNEDPSEVPPTV